MLACACEGLVVSDMGVVGMTSVFVRTESVSVQLTQLLGEQMLVSCSRGATTASASVVSPVYTSCWVVCVCVCSRVRKYA